MATTVKGAIPYKGDDVPQTMAKTMAEPMIGMGLMSVVVGFVLGIVAGVNFGDAFSPSGTETDLGTGQALVQLTGAFIFLGMGFILAGITMLLVKIVRVLRDGGRDVQHALGAEELQLRKPWTGKLTPHLMMMGVLIEVVAFILGIVAATAAGSGFGEGVVADQGTATAFGAWLPGLRFVGVVTILTAITLTLVTIRKVLRFQTERIEELGSQGTPQSTAAERTPVTA